MTAHHAQRATQSNRYSFSAGHWWTPTRGARLPTGHDTLTDRVDALLLVCPPKAAIVGPTAALLWDLPLPQRLEEGPMHVNVASRGFHVDRPDVACHRQVLRPGDVQVLDGRRLTTPLRTLLDLGPYLEVADLVAVADVILRRNLATLPELQARAAGHRRRRGIVGVREALEYAHPGAESPRESAMRFHLWQAGLRNLEPNVDIHDRRGNFIARGDLVDRDARIVVEYDGLHHLTRDGQASDAERRLLLGLNDWLMVTAVPSDLHPPSRLVAKVFAAYDSRQAHQR